MDFRILAIETSCDETAAAIYTSDQGIIAHEVFSQTILHQQHGGVIPEIASRTQLEKIAPIIRQTLDIAGMTIDDIDIVAVTNKPGLPGSLLVGVCFAKAIAWALQKKLIGIDHLEGHIYSSFLENKVPFPHLCLSASGGHTALYYVTDFGKYEIIGQTKDDAAGEAFDKIAKLIGLPYPGGPIIEKMAQEAGFEDFLSYPRASHNQLDFSFSGLKTSVIYDLIKRKAYDLKEKKFLKEEDLYFKQQVASSLLVCIAEIFVNKFAVALKKYPDVKAITFVGGVACNKYISAQIAAFAQASNLLFFKPSPIYCTDNAAMIAFVAAYKAKQEKFSNFDLDILR